MRERDKLHKSHLADFKDWLIADGWTIEPTKGDYEVLRARKPDKDPVIFYAKMYPTEHITTFGLGSNLAHQFLHARRVNRESIVTFE